MRSVTWLPGSNLLTRSDISPCLNRRAMILALDGTDNGPLHYTWRAARLVAKSAVAVLLTFGRWTRRNKSHSQPCNHRHVVILCSHVHQFSPKALQDHVMILMRFFYPNLNSLSSRPSIQYPLNLIRAHIANPRLRHIAKETPEDVEVK
jgi:hypothetical protein